MAPPADSTGRRPASPRPAPCCVTAPRPRRARPGTDRDALDQIAALGAAVGHHPPAVRRRGHADGPRGARRRARRERLRPALRRRRPGPSCPATSGSRCATTRSSTWPRSPSCSPRSLVMQQVEGRQSGWTSRWRRTCRSSPPTARRPITVRQLLTHTSGLQPDLPLWRDWPDQASRIAAVLDVAPTSTRRHDLRLQRPQPDHPRRAARAADREQPGPARGAGASPRPLGMKDTGYNPPALKPRIAATEFQTAPRRGMVRGEVHDENAWSLGGVAGHAGVFSTAHDLAILAQAMLNGGTYGGHRILVAVERRADDHQLQPGLPRRRARARLRARPALVHGRPVRAPHRRPHRLHRHVARDRLRLPLVRDPADQPRAPVPRLGQQQPRPPGGGAGPRLALGVTPRQGADRVVQRHERRDDRHPDHARRSTCRGRRACRSTCSSTPSPRTRSPWSPPATAAATWTALPFGCATADDG